MQDHYLLGEPSVDGKNEMFQQAVHIIADGLGYQPVTPLLCNCGSDY